MTVEIIDGEKEGSLDHLLNKTVAVIGYGNQGHAHALNLRDSGIKVCVSNRPHTENARRAQESEFEVMEIASAVARADLVIIALPDEVQPGVYEKTIAPNIQQGSTIGFLHGFNICYGLIEPATDIGVVLVAPKGPGATLRERYMNNQGMLCLFAVHQESPSNDAEVLGLAWASAIGGNRAGIIRTTFKAETETDLFGEQAVLCGGLSHLIRVAFETLVDAGYPPELAYLECCHEVKQIADLIFENGLAGMTKSISNTAEFGTYSAEPAIADDNLRSNMRELLKRIQDGSFAKQMRTDFENGFTWFDQQRQAWKDHPIESAGQAIRSLSKGNSD